MGAHVLRKVEKSALDDVMRIIRDTLYDDGPQEVRQICESLCLSYSRVSEVLTLMKHQGDVTTFTRGGRGALRTYWILAEDA